MHETRQLHGAEIKANSSSTSNEIPRILWDPKFHYFVYKSLPLVPILSNTNPFHVATILLKDVLILSSHLYVGLRSSFFPLDFPTKTLYSGPLTYELNSFPRAGRNSTWS
jgi:hypothetical protein